MTKNYQFVQISESYATTILLSKATSNLFSNTNASESNKYSSHFKESRIEKNDLKYLPVK